MHHIGRLGAVSFLLGVVCTPHNTPDITRMCGGIVGDTCVGRGVAKSGIVMFMVGLHVRCMGCIGSNPVDLASQDFAVVNRNRAPSLLGMFRDLVPCIVLEACSRVRWRSGITGSGCG